MTDEDLTNLVKNINFDTGPGGWAEEPDKEFVNETSNLGPQRNAARNIRMSQDEAAADGSIGVEESLEDSMEAIDFLADKYQSGNKLDANLKKDKVTI